MFQPFPGFENFELRVEVEWHGRAQIVVARLESLPDSSSSAVLVCHLENAPDDGEWLVLDSFHAPLRVSRCQLNRIAKLRRIVRNAFLKRYLTVGRVVYWAELPQEPRLCLLVAPFKGFWLLDWNEIEWPERTEKATSFNLRRSIAQVAQGEAVQIAMCEWNDEFSDTRFAWNWAQKNRDEEMALLCGFDGDWSDLRRVMRLVLLCDEPLWKGGSVWRWALHREFAGRGWLVNASDRRDTSQSARLAPWQNFLFDHFVPHLQTQILKTHVCARQFWEQGGELEHVELSSSPTMHEQLEARLELRDWLETNASHQQRRWLLPP